MTIAKLVHLGFYLNGAQGIGKYDFITIEDIKDYLENNILFSSIEEELGDSIDTSLLSFEDKITLNA